LALPFQFGLAGRLGGSRFGAAAFGLDGGLPSTLGGGSGFGSAPGLLGAPRLFRRGQPGLAVALQLGRGVA
jgi:hypothetical protein